jgi:hypothetical protein
MLNRFLLLHEFPTSVSKKNLALRNLRSISHAFDPSRWRFAKILVHFFSPLESAIPEERIFSFVDAALSPAFLSLLLT